MFTKTPSNLVIYIGPDIDGDNVKMVCKIQVLSLPSQAIY